MASRKNKKKPLRKLKFIKIQLKDEENIPLN
jgi:hypothetical protein